MKPREEFDTRKASSCSFIDGSYTDTYTYKHIRHTYICMIYIYIEMYTRTHMHAYIHAYIRTYIHAYIHVGVHYSADDVLP